MENLPKYIFWCSAVLLIILCMHTLYGWYNANQEYALAINTALNENNPEICNTLKNFHDAAVCYNPFVNQGYICTSDPCFFAEAISKKDDEYCDVLFSGTKLPLNIECRVSVFIERYTNEGLSDCCNLK